MADRSGYALCALNFIVHHQGCLMYCQHMLMYAYVLGKQTPWSVLVSVFQYRNVTRLFISYFFSALRRLELALD